MNRMLVVHPADVRDERRAETAPQAQENWPPLFAESPDATSVRSKFASGFAFGAALI